MGPRNEGSTGGGRRDETEGRGGGREGLGTREARSPLNVTADWLDAHDT